MVSRRKVDHIGTLKPSFYSEHPLIYHKKLTILYSRNHHFSIGPIDICIKTYLRYCSAAIPETTFTDQTVALHDGMHANVHHFKAEFIIFSAKFIIFNAEYVK